MGAYSSSPSPCELAYAAKMQAAQQAATAAAVQAGGAQIQTQPPQAGGAQPQPPQAGGGAQQPSPVPSAAPPPPATQPPRPAAAKVPYSEPLYLPAMFTGTPPLVRSAGRQRALYVPVNQRGKPAPSTTQRSFPAPIPVLF